jgi:hypothetical protein
VHLEHPLERIDPVAEPARAGPGWIRTADAVIAYLKVETVILDREMHERAVRLRVLGDVGQRLGGDEISSVWSRRCSVMSVTRVSTPSAPNGSAR